MRNIFILFSISLLLGCQPEKQRNTNISDYDVCIYGGTSSGVVAAYTAYKMGKSVVIIEPSNHLGGLSASGLGMTDVGNKDIVTGLSRDFYRRLGKEYDKFEQWRFERHIAEKVFHQYIEEGKIPVYYEKWLLGVKKDEHRITSLNFHNPKTNKDTLEIEAKIFIDCTYEGDLMAKAGISYTIGREPNEAYEEQHNGVQLITKTHQFPDNISPYIIENDVTSGVLPGIHSEFNNNQGSGDYKVQAYNFRLCLTQDVTNQIPFYKPEKYYPEEYELLIRWLKTKPHWTLNELAIFSGMPNGKTDVNNRGAISTDVIGRNWSYPESDFTKRQEIIDFHKHYTQGYFYFLTTDLRVPENLRKEAKTWGYAKDEFKDNKGFPHQIYVREARRMIGEYVMTENNCLGRETVKDGVGMAAYGMDSHHCQRVIVNGQVKNEGNINVEGFAPYSISYRSITPKRGECENLLVPVALSASHIAHGSIRMEPVFMVLGQSAGIAASMAIDEEKMVQEIDITNLQKLLKADPQLNQKPQDILLDDNDPSSFTYLGDWKKIVRNEIPQPYKGSYFLKEGDTKKVSARFTPTIKNVGKYEVYYFHPFVMDVYNHSKKTVFIIKANGEEYESIVDFTTYPINQYWGEWVKLGDYNFTGKNTEYIELVGEKSEPPLVADAVILVWSENNRHKKP